MIEAEGPHDRPEEIRGYQSSMALISRYAVVLSWKTGPFVTSSTDCPVRSEPLDATEARADETAGP